MLNLNENQLDDLFALNPEVNKADLQLQNQIKCPSPKAENIILCDQEIESFGLIDLYIDKIQQKYLKFGYSTNDILNFLKKNSFDYDSTLQYLENFQKYESKANYF